MRYDLIALLGFLSAFASAAYSGELDGKVEHEWSAQFLSGLSEHTQQDFNLQDGYRAEISEKVSDLTLRTQSNSDGSDVIGSYFSGCNGYINAGEGELANKWAPTGQQTGCTTLIVPSDFPRGSDWSEIDLGQYKPITEVSLSLRQESEGVFYAITQRIDQQVVDWDNGLLIWIDRENQPLAVFKLKGELQ